MKQWLKRRLRRFAKWEQGGTRHAPTDKTTRAYENGEEIQVLKVYQEWILCFRLRNWLCLEYERKEKFTGVTFPEMSSGQHGTIEYEIQFEPLDELCAFLHHELFDAIRHVERDYKKGLDQLYRDFDSRRAQVLKDYQDREGED